MTNLKEKNLFRLKFWCESILRNTPKKNKTLNSFSGKLTIVEDDETDFFPVENAVDSDKSRKDATKDKLKSIDKYGSKLNNLLDTRMRFKYVYVLFLDNCRE
eukprot:snap_masked-scaffold_9-processed-gene-13.83-mRNA-1 protein AED:1.00 eAED:1.00 QI:0/0/0/0/1/1/3/0/101